MVGQDFEKRVIDSDKDAIVLVYHPLSEKNRGLKQKFEQFAKANTSDKLLVARMNGGCNESAVYKVPKKLPALVYFKRQEDGSFKQITEYDRTREHMLRTSTNEKFSEAMKEFI